MLRALQVAHLRTVPFENLSVRRDEAILLDEEWLFRKVVERHRGGYCYELNGLFAALLEALGFRVERLAGRVGEASIDFDHLVLRVTLDEPWLVDVGFGDSFLHPLKLLARRAQEGGDGRSYQLEERGGELVLSRRGASEWERQFSFTPEVWTLADFEPGNRYHQTSPASHFTQNTVVSRATPSGRITLSGLRLMTTRDGERSETTLAGEAEVAEVLQRSFGIRM